MFRCCDTSSLGAPHALPAGWRIERDPATGAPVFVNGSTGEVASAPPAELPEGWHATLDVQAADTAYLNDGTGEAQRERPTALPPGWALETDPTTGAPGGCRPFRATVTAC